MPFFLAFAMFDADDELVLHCLQITFAERSESYVAFMRVIFKLYFVIYRGVLT